MPDNTHGTPNDIASNGVMWNASNVDAERYTWAPRTAVRPDRGSRTGPGPTLPGCARVAAARIGGPVADRWLLRRRPMQTGRPHRLPSVDQPIESLVEIPMMNGERVRATRSGCTCESRSQATPGITCVGSETQRIAWPPRRRGSGTRGRGATLRNSARILHTVAAQIRERRNSRRPAWWFGFWLNRICRALARTLAKPPIAYRTAPGSARSVDGSWNCSPRCVAPWTVAARTAPPLAPHRCRPPTPPCTRSLSSR